MTRMKISGVDSPVYGRTALVYGWCTKEPQLLPYCATFGAVNTRQHVNKGFFMGDDKTIKPCPCGETPASLNIIDGNSKWALVTGNCCGEWHIDFRTKWAGYRGDLDELNQLALAAWNEAPRGGVE